MYRELTRRIWALEAQDLPESQVRTAAKALKATADAEIDPLRARIQRARTTNAREEQKLEQYGREQRQLLRAVAALTASERTMDELDDAKDQVMTIGKTALANLVMWTRDRSFPASYAQATWARLAPFFRLPGRGVGGPDTVQVELRPFNDRWLNRALAAVCRCDTAVQPRVPDGRPLRLTMCGTSRPVLDAPARLVACLPGCGSGEPFSGESR